MLPGVEVRVPSLVMCGVQRRSDEEVDLEAAGLILSGTVWYVLAVCAEYRLKENQMLHVRCSILVS